MSYDVDVNADEKAEHLSKDKGPQIPTPGHVGDRLTRPLFPCRPTPLSLRRPVPLYLTHEMIHTHVSVYQEIQQQLTRD